MRLSLMSRPQAYRAGQLYYRFAKSVAIVGEGSVRKLFISGCQWRIPRLYEGWGQQIAPGAVVLLLCDVIDKTSSMLRYAT